MSNALKVLIVEDSEDDFQLLLRELRLAGGEIESRRVQNRESLRKALDDEWDMVISDYSMPGFDGLAALSEVQSSGRDIPFILVSGSVGEEIAVDAMLKGAGDYIRKDQLHRLAPAVQRELRELQERRERREVERQLERQNALNRARVAMWKMAAEPGVRTQELVQKLLELAGTVLGVSRACLNVREGDDFRCVSEWCRPETTSTLRTKLPVSLVHGLFQNQAVMIDAELMLKRFPESLHSVARGVVELYQRVHDIDRVLAVPHLDEDGEAVLTFDICRSLNPKPVLDEAAQSFIGELSAIVVNQSTIRRARERAEWLSRLPNEDPAPVLRLDTGASVLYANPAAAKLLESWRDNNGKYRIPEHIRAGVEQSFERGVVSTLEAGAGGRVYAFTVSPEKTLGYANLYGADITERLRATTILEQNEDRLRSLLALFQTQFDNAQQWLEHALSEAVRLTGSKTGYLYRYDEDRRQFAINTRSAGEMKENTAFDPRTVCELETAGIWGETVHRRKPVIVNDFTIPDIRRKGYLGGHNSWSRLLVVPLFQDKRIVAVIGVADKAGPYDDNDVTQLTLLMDAVWRELNRRAANEEQDRLRIQLEQSQRIESVGQLVGGVAHDFNNLLTAILSYASMTMNRLEPHSKEHGYVAQIHAVAQRASALARQLLLFTRRESVTPVAVNINRMVDAMLTMLRRLLGEQVTIEFRPGEGLPTALGDEGRLEQVLMNLAVNARDAMQSGGTLTVVTTTRTLSDRDCIANLHRRPGEFIVLEMSDTGSGMSDDILEHIFEPFFTTKQPGKGTGLGLSLVYGIIKQHNGWVEVASRPGEGSAFTVFLPRADTENSVSQPIVETPVHRKRGNGERVLLVEDDDIIRELAAEALVDDGFAVTAVASVARARECLHAGSESFDILVSDVILPDGNALQIVDALTESAPQCRVLLASGYPDDESRRELIQKRNLPFLRKPYDLRELVEMVAGIVR